MAVTEVTTIMIDKDTRARLGALAAGVPLSRYLRELTVKMCGGWEPESRTEEKLDEIYEALIKELDGVKNLIRPSLFSRLDKAGKMVPVVVMPGVENQIDQTLIDQALEENPDVKDVGFYHRNDDGSWSWVEERWQEVLNEMEGQRKKQNMEFDKAQRKYIKKQKLDSRDKKNVA